MSEITKAHVVELIRTTLEANGWSASRLAREAGVSPSTITRALDPKAKFIPSTRTMAKIFSVTFETRIGAVDKLVDVWASATDAIAQYSVDSDIISVVGEVRAGAWVNDNEIGPFRSDVFLKIDDSSLKSLPRVAYRIVGDNSDPFYKDGTILLVGSESLPFVVSGDLPICRRRVDLFLDSKFETALYEVQSGKDGHELYPRAERPDEAPETDQKLNDIAPLTVLGVVIAVYTRRYRLRGPAIALSELKLVQSRNRPLR